MSKITEFTASQYQLEQDQIQPPDALIQSVQRRIHQQELVTTQTTRFKVPAWLVASFCLVASVVCFFVVSPAPSESSPYYYPNEGYTVEEKNMEQHPPIENGHNGPRNQYEKNRSEEKRQETEDVEQPPPREIEVSKSLSETT